ncbi:hypothetical protein Ancab_028508, partial [Ancistrocladus abbreviatus]
IWIPDFEPTVRRLPDSRPTLLLRFSHPIRPTLAAGVAVWRCCAPAPQSASNRRNHQGVSSKQPIYQGLPYIEAGRGLGGMLNNKKNGDCFR